MSFNAVVSGTNFPGVEWQLSPPVGSLVNGTYTAPAIISSPQAITLIVRSYADPSKAASATIYLIASVGISITPSSVSVGAGQSAQFSTSIAGALNTSVTWSLHPPVGTIVNGLYTAPASIAKAQAIVVTAASLADPSKTAQASITLQPSQPISISINPTQIALRPSQTVQFATTVQGATGAGIHWTVAPNLGSISPTGLYTAPASLPGGQTVVVTAALDSDPDSAASATITLASATPPPPTPPIQLPVEVITLDGGVVTVPFTIPQGANLSGSPTLSMQIHGLRYETQASVQVNNSGWQPINHTTVALSANAAAYGGIGGGFSTLTMTMNMAAGTLTPGTNAISFRFNGTDGRVSGFRVLNFNFLDVNGNSLLGPGAFVNEDPNTWQPPSSLASDISAGKTLYYTAPLTKPTPGGPVAIQAHCSDCHAQDGRDLKYFNYSNNSIRTRAMFHGLTAQQGDQIASYIRTLNVVNPGRPWNPPYQPGPGLDEGPVLNWAAGAGLDAVLDNDQAMLNGMFPNGIQTSVFSASGNLSVRETAVPFQFPDWNQWLPGTAPIDAFGTAFTNSGYDTIYQTLRANLRVGDATTYAGQSANFKNWNNAYYSLFQQVEAPILAAGSSAWTPTLIDQVYSLPQWGMVKTWEIMNEFQLEGFGQSIFASTQADQRAWFSSLPFSTSPHILHFPPGVVGLRNGSADVYNYLAYIWYHLQLILNNSNKQQGDHSPIDWGYSFGFAKNMSEMVAPAAGLETMWMIKALQISNNGQGPNVYPTGWQPIVNNLGWLLIPEANLYEWNGVASSTRAAIYTGILGTWMSEVSQFTPQQFYAGNWTTATATPVPGGNPYGAFPDWVWYLIPRLKSLGVDPTLVGQFAAWAQTMWPNANWTADLNATCNAPSTYDGTMTCTQ